MSSAAYAQLIATKNSNETNTPNTETTLPARRRAIAYERALPLGGSETMPFAPPPLEKGRSVRVADREGIAFARCIDPHPPRCARRPPLFKGRWSKWHTRCDTPRTEVVRANAKCDSPAARGQRWSERRSRRVHLWSESKSRQPGIDVSGIGLDRQGSEPAADRVGAQPGCVHELLAFAQHRIVAEAPERLATRKAGLRDLALDRGKFERERGERPAQPQQRLGLEPLHVDLGKGRDAMAGDELVKGGHGNVDAPGPG